MFISYLYVFYTETEQLYRKNTYKNLRTYFLKIYKVWSAVAHFAHLMSTILVRLWY